MKKTKIHQPLLFGIEEALEKIFGQGKKSDQVVPAVLKAHPKWGSRDRHFVAENTYEMVRNKRLLEYVLGEEAQQAAAGLDENEQPVSGRPYRKMVQAWLILKGYEDISPGAPDPETVRTRAAVAVPEIRFSVPDPLSALVKKELGEERWYKELEAMSRPADVFLRVNLHRILREQLKKSLEERGFFTEEVPGVDSALKLLKRSNLTLTEEFRKGYFEIQDAGSQLISPFLGAVSGELVIDACAGAGGKTLHLADLMHNKGQLLALDVEMLKLKELETRAKRNMVRIISTGMPDEALIAGYALKADRLLLDVPCSGLGVIRRNPDAKEALSAGFLDEIREVQAEILQSYSRMVKPGGRLVYATCSILPSENREQVDNFLAGNRDYSLVEDRQIWPSESGFDGFYMASIQKG